MIRRLPALLFAASPRRAARDASAFAALALLALQLMLPSIADNVTPLLSGLGSGAIAALVLALRLRLPAGSFFRQAGFELGIAALCAAALAAYGMALMVVHTGLEAGQPWGLGFSGAPGKAVLAVGMFMSFHGATYLGCRLLARAARWWNGLRRRSLLLALTHDQIIAVMAIMLIVGAIGAAAVLGNSLSAPLPDGESGHFATFMRQVFSLALLGPFYAAVTVAMMIGALPLAVLLAYLLVRRIVRRIESLAQATEAFRRGDYARRVEVAGQDEIARLQTNFNAMAADLERTLRDLQAERDRVADLLRLRRELIASVSHELRTPVATLRGYLDAALEPSSADLGAGDNPHWSAATSGSLGAAPPARIQADLAVMQRETVRLQGLIDDLFALAGAEAGRMRLQCQPGDLGAAAERIVATVAPLAWRGGRVEVIAQIQPDLPPAVFDEERFAQVLRNLLHNAIRHTPPGGIVLVAVEAGAEAVIMRVSDTGEGIAAADLPRIWDRFFRAAGARDRDTAGAGLGLALVKELTEAMGGSVEAASAPGAGSAFTVRLPRAASAEPPPARD